MYSHLEKVLCLGLELTILLNMPCLRLAIRVRLFVILE